MRGQGEPGTPQAPTPARRSHRPRQPPQASHLYAPDHPPAFRVQGLPRGAAGRPQPQFCPHSACTAFEHLRKDGGEMPVRVWPPPLPTVRNEDHPPAEGLGDPHAADSRPPSGSEHPPMRPPGKSQRGRPISTWSNGRGHPTRSHKSGPPKQGQHPVQGHAPTHAGFPGAAGRPSSPGVLRQALDAGGAAVCQSPGLLLC